MLSTNYLEANNTERDIKDINESLCPKVSQFYLCISQGDTDIICVYFKIFCCLVRLNGRARSPQSNRHKNLRVQIENLPSSSFTMMTHKKK